MSTISFKSEICIKCGKKSGRFQYGSFTLDEDEETERPDLRPNNRLFQYLIRYAMGICPYCLYVNKNISFDSKLKYNDDPEFKKILLNWRGKDYKSSDELQQELKLELIEDDDLTKKGQLKKHRTVTNVPDVSSWCRDDEFAGNIWQYGGLLLMRDKYIIPACDAFINASWFYENCENKEKEKHALISFVRASSDLVSQIGNGAIPKKILDDTELSFKIQLVILRCADIYRILGNFKSAMATLELLNIFKVTSNLQNIVNLEKDLIDSYIPIRETRTRQRS